MSGLDKKLSVAKTIKLYIGGAFPRTESGRSFQINYQGSKNVYAELCRASRKDLRNAVAAAKKASSGWAGKTAYNRGQILYRMAEMTESRRSEFIETLTQTLDISEKKASAEVDAAIDAFVYYAGFSDKYQTLLGTLNPVAGPHHNFTAVTPVGVTALLYDKNSLGSFAAQLSAMIVSGNVVVALIPQELSAILAPLAEVFATSDLPGGVINLLTGYFDELFEHVASHMEIDSVSFQVADPEKQKELQIQAAENMKRVVLPVDESLSLKHLLAFTEYKTVWHPIGR